ncbi:MAG: hypothetical protein HGA65_09780, partial [Oscillochloris sp.]|nr:hypothetical protein [Oscillochloris sp.]
MPASQILPPAPQLADLLAAHRDVIIEAWLGLIRRRPDSPYAALAPQELRAAADGALAAMLESLLSGSPHPLDSHLQLVGLRRLQMGFSLGEIIDALLQAGPAALPVLLSPSAFPAEQAIGLFDAYQHRAIGYFVASYSELTARDVREQ